MPTDEDLTLLLEAGDELTRAHASVELGWRLRRRAPETSLALLQKARQSPDAILPWLDIVALRERLLSPAAAATAEPPALPVASAGPLWTMRGQMVLAGLLLRGPRPSAALALWEPLHTLLMQIPEIPDEDRGHVQLTLGRLARALDDLSQAGERARLAEAAYRRAGWELGVVSALTNQGNAASELGDVDQALVCYREALLCLDRQPDMALTIAVLSNAAAACWRLGDMARAHRHAHRALELLTESTQHIDPLQELNTLALLSRIALERGELSQAERWLSRIRELADTIGSPAFRRVAAYGEASLLLHQGQPAAALAHLSAHAPGVAGARAAVVIQMRAIQATALSALHRHAEVIALIEPILSSFWVSQQPTAEDILELLLRAYLETGAAERAAVVLQSRQALVEAQHARRQRCAASTGALDLASADAYATLSEQIIRHLHERLAQTERLWVAGQAMAGMAHDVKNLLTIMQLEADALSQTAMLPEDLREPIANIHTATTRASALVQQLLSAARLPDVTPTRLDLAAAIQRQQGGLRTILGAAVALRILLDVVLPPVRVAEEVLSQILLNLVLNARAAMGAEGTVTLRAWAEERQVLLSVADTGAGIPSHDLPYIFEPFYTTRTAGQGTGLGLATVRSSMRRLGGSVSVTSRPGAGTTFLLRFPLA